MIRPQQAGVDYEHGFAERNGLDRVPGSGNGDRYKLDVGNVEVLISLKWTGAESFRITAEDMRETLAGAGGPGGRGQLGILVARMEGIGEEVATMRWSDLLAVLSGEVELGLRPNGRAAKLAAADPLAYLNQGENE